MNFSYLLYQAEHVRSAREQREADARAGDLAGSFARLWRSLLPASRQTARCEACRSEAIGQCLCDSGALT